MNTDSVGRHAAAARWMGLARRIALAPIALIAASLVVLLVAGYRVNVHSEQLSRRLSAERQSIETVTNIRRDTRKGYVALLERWLASPNERDLLSHSLLLQKSELIRSSKQFVAAPALSDSEQQRREALAADLAKWSALIDRVVESSQGPEVRPEARVQLDAIDRNCDEILSINVRGANRDDRSRDDLRRDEEKIQIAFVVLLALLSLLSALWYLQGIAARRVEEMRRRQREQEQQAVELERLVRDRTSELSSAKRELEQRVVELATAHNQLLQAEKLQAVGQLAAGIAHEINTPVQYVGDSVSFLAESFTSLQELLSKYRNALQALRAAPGGPAIAEELAKSEEEADLGFIVDNAPCAFDRASEGIARIGTIVRAMKEFAHPDTREKSPADLNRALQTTAIIAKNEFKFVADLHADLGDIPPVTCHVGDLNQVFLNLIVNAAHAIRDAVGDSGSKGEIRIRTRHEEPMVRIDIEDTGTGLPESIRNRVFESFFTTKEVGKGTGQGLAIARSIVVDKHGGTLTFDSEVGKGTTFTVRLPVDGESAPAS